MNRIAILILAVAVVPHFAVRADDHWSYRAPRRPTLPHLTRGDWARGAIDLFVLDRLRREKLSPSPKADKERLIRRVTFDLTGLPPTLDEIDAFLTDKSPDAYDRVVDRLLASPRHGERMAMDWLDLARYADTHGYHIDSHRDMWRWRDWVIEAFNRGMTFDQFTIEQLAGDLLPNATLSQRIATGFNRNNMVNFEGGAIAEEYLTEYVVDRVVTTSTVWLGQTFLCARCHDHKYDPITQHDFFRLFAFFNDVDELGLDGRTGNAAPFIAAPTDEQRWQLARLDERIKQLAEQLAARAADAAADQTAWERKLLAGAAQLPKPPGDMTAYFPLDESDGGTILETIGERKVTLHGASIFVPGKFADGLLFDGQTHLDAGPLEMQREEPFSLAAWIYPTTKDRMAIIAKADDEDPFRGVALLMDEGQLGLHLTHKSDNAIRVDTSAVMELRRWQHVLATYDGSGKANGLRLYLDGNLQETTIAADTLTGAISTEQPLRIGGYGESAFRGMMDDVRLYGRQLDATEAALLAGSNPIREIVALATEDRSEQQIETLRKYYLENEDASFKRIFADHTSADKQRNRIRKSIPTTMVMKRAAKPRDTFLLARGDYRNPLEKVTAGTPAVLPPMPNDAPANRLGLARWLVDPQHPLTARVTVNRFWQTYFGTGLVKTPEDFGSRGELPTHPELLDWLAREFVDSGWDTKRMQRLIVTSATYRQSSRMTRESLQQDPRNRLLARGPRQVLYGEFIRDAALSAGGLLDRRLGGPSVYPYQPPGLWEEVSFNPRDFTAQVYVQSHGADLYRRGMYSFWKRAVPPPALQAFGAPDRETCTVQRRRSNTPMHSLILMNDPTFVEAARALAERMMMEAGSNAEQRAAFGFRLVTSRRPNQDEVDILLDLFQSERTRFENSGDDAQKFLAVGESQHDGTLNETELAAWTAVAGMIMGLDEAISN